MWRFVAPFNRRYVCNTGLACVTLLLLGALVACQYNSTLPSDIRALQRLRDALQPSNSSTFLSWTNDTDPCINRWRGVECDCSRVWSGINCQATPDPSGYLRVLSVDLSRMANKGSTLTGTLPTNLGALSALLFLDLSNNNISGTLPDGLANLNTVQQLVLSGNRLTGPVPEWLGSMQALSTAWLDRNHLEGPLPDTLCAGGGTFYISDNSNICGRVPAACTINQIPEINNTYLMRQLDVQGAHACDATPPVCTAPACRVLVPDPPVWTSTTNLTFTFTDFRDDESGVNADMYQWGLGTSPGLTDALGPLPFTGNRTGQMVQMEQSSQSTFTTTYTQTANLAAAGQQLVNGRSYYITVIAFNNAGPRRSANVSSAVPIKVDSTPPIPGQVYNTAKWTYASVQTSRRSLGISWANFTDPETGIRNCTVQFFQILGAYGRPGQPMAFKNLTALIPVEQPTNSWFQVNTLELMDGKSYFARLTVINGAGLKLVVDAVPVKVDSKWGKGVDAGNVAIAIVLCSLGCLAVGAVTALLVVRGRLHQQTQREKERQREQKQVKALMHALTIPSVSARAKGLEALAGAMEFAFVITDVESSTEQSAASPTAFAQMQDIHDQVMREGIAKYSGYEIVTEGDSFSIAFTNVQDAVQFCLETQYRLLETNWPKMVLRLPSCKPIADADGELIWKGPRIRMGVHWAAAGTVACRLHQLTKTRIFAGPGFQIAQEVGEAAHGGQVLLTHPAWEMLRTNMPGAGFPVISQLGLFRLQQTSDFMWLYQVVEMVGKPMQRSFGPPRKLDSVGPGLGLHIMPPPISDSDGSLAFVTARLSSMPKGRPRLPVAVGNKLAEVIAMQAQQFQGYLFDSQKFEGRFNLVFEQVMDAVRFCHAAQMLLMVTKWPPEAADFCGPAVPNPDGRWVFRGPRVAMAIHESDEYGASRVDLPCHHSEEAYTYYGTAVTFATALSAAIRGGQVVLSDRAWDSVKPFVSEHPGASQVISLGTHIFSEEFPQPVLLTEVMPNLLSRRSFKPPQTLVMLEPGYREAPKPAEPMVIIFVKVQKPEEVLGAERGGQEFADVVPCITAYTVAVQQYTTLARQLMRLYDGYECKEPEPGKFTLCFRLLPNAIRWCAAVQRELLKVEWPEQLMRMRDCEVITDEAGRTVWSGLRVRMGMSYGYASSKKPLNSGRADYFGPLPNTAARVAALAAPGQVLVECSLMTPDIVGVISEGGTTLLPACPPPGASNTSFTTCHTEETIEISPLGSFLLRGLDGPRTIYQVVTDSLAARHFPVVREQLVTDMTSRTSRNDSWSSKPRMLQMWLWGGKKPPATSRATSRSNQSGSGWGPHIGALNVQAAGASSSGASATGILNPTHSAPTGQGSYTRQRMSLLAQFGPYRAGSPHSMPPDLRLDSFQGPAHLQQQQQQQATSAASVDTGTPYRVDSEGRMQGLPGFSNFNHSFSPSGDVEASSFSQCSAITLPPSRNNPSPLPPHPLHSSVTSRGSAPDHPLSTLHASGPSRVSLTDRPGSFTSAVNTSVTSITGAGPSYTMFAPTGSHPMVHTLSSPGSSPRTPDGDKPRRSRVLRALRIRRSSSSLKKSRSKLSGQYPPAPSSSAVSSASSSPYRKGVPSQQLTAQQLFSLHDTWPPVAAPPDLPLDRHSGPPSPRQQSPKSSPHGSQALSSSDPSAFAQEVAYTYLNANRPASPPAAMLRSQTLCRSEHSHPQTLPDRSFSMDLHTTTTTTRQSHSPRTPYFLDPLAASSSLGHSQLTLPFPPGGPHSLAPINTSVPSALPAAVGPAGISPRSPRRSPFSGQIGAIEEDGPSYRADPVWITNSMSWRPSSLPSSSPSPSPRASSTFRTRRSADITQAPPTALPTPFNQHPSSPLSRNSSLNTSATLPRHPSPGHHTPGHHSPGHHSPSHRTTL